MTDDHDTTYGLIMPFVVCDDHGGPYDAAAFVAGYRCGQIDLALQSLGWLGIPTYTLYVESQLVPQLDLLAMRYGWTFTSEPWDEHPDDWTLARFDRPEALAE